MNNKYKILITIIFAVVFVSAVSVMAENKDSGRLVFLSDEYYSIVKKATSNNIIMQEHIQDRDVLMIENSIIDTSSHTPIDEELLLLINNDPDAVLPDNIRMDGLYYVDNKDEIISTLLDELSCVVKMDIDYEGAPHIEKIEKTPLTLSISDKQLYLYDVKSCEESVLVPKTVDYAQYNIVHSNNDDFNLVIDYDCIYRVDKEGKITKLNDVWNGYTYEDISSTSDYYTFWNEQVAISPNNNRIAYISNKSSLDGSMKVFVNDKDEERCITQDDCHNYNVLGWINDTVIMCRQFTDDGERYIGLTIDGEIIDSISLNCGGDFLGAKDDFIALGENGAVLLLRWDGGFKLVKKIILNGKYCIRPGMKPFNDDCSKLAILYAPKNRAMNRRVLIVDVLKGIIRDDVFINSENDKVGILEYDWIDNVKMLLSVKDFESTEISSWLYYGE